MKLMGMKADPPDKYAHPKIKLRSGAIYAARPEDVADWESKAPDAEAGEWGLGDGRRIMYNTTDDGKEYYTIIDQNGQRTNYAGVSKATWKSLTSPPELPSSGGGEAPRAKGGNAAAAAEMLEKKRQRDAMASGEDEGYNAVPSTPVSDPKPGESGRLDFLRKKAEGTGLYPGSPERKEYDSLLNVAKKGIKTAKVKIAGR